MHFVPISRDERDYHQDTAEDTSVWLNLAHVVTAEVIKSGDEFRLQARLAEGGLVFFGQRYLSNTTAHIALTNYLRG
jgi:hypothetical protein